MAFGKCHALVVLTVHVNKCFHNDLERVDVHCITVIASGLFVCMALIASCHAHGLE